MKVMVLVKASEQSEAGAMPSEAILTKMAAFNEQLVSAGVMVDGDGLQPSSKGVRVAFDSDGGSTVNNGPFGDAGELVSGYWIWQVDSLHDATDWLRRAPFRGTEIEIRPFIQAEDFGEAFTPELREQEDELRRRLRDE